MNEFLKAFHDFSKECSDAEEELESLLYHFYEQQAIELDISTEYYVQEFVLN